MAWRLKLFLSDNNGHKAETGVNLRDGSSFDAALSYAVVLEAAIAAISTARIDGAEYGYELKRVFDTPVDPVSDMEKDALLFYRNGLNVASFRVPSPRELLFETSGPYAGIRITRNSLDMQQLLQTVDNMLQGSVDALGRPIGTGFVVGGRSRK